MYVFEYTNKEQCSYPYLITEEDCHRISFSQEIMSAISCYGTGVDTLYNEIMDNQSVDQIWLTNDEFNYLKTIFEIMEIKYCTKF